jgi:hypothetical protein
VIPVGRDVRGLTLSVWSPFLWFRPPQQRADLVGRAGAVGQVDRNHHIKRSLAELARGRSEMLHSGCPKFWRRQLTAETVPVGSPVVMVMELSAPKPSDPLSPLGSSMRAEDRRGPELEPAGYWLTADLPNSKKIISHTFAVVNPPALVAEDSNFLLGYGFNGRLHGIEQTRSSIARTIFSQATL